MAALVVIGVCLVGAVILFAAKSPLLFPGNPTSVSQAGATLQNTPGKVGKTAVTPAPPGGIKATLPAVQAATETAPAGPTETRPPIVSIKGLPADIPVLPQNFGDLITSDNANMSSFIFTTWLPLDQVTEYYSQAMIDQGWTIMNTTSVDTPPSKIYTFTKDDNKRMINVQMTTPKDKPYTMIMLMMVKMTP